MAIPRKYAQLGPEIVNSQPIPRPPAQVTIDVIPEGDVVTFETIYENYTWGVLLDQEGNLAGPAMHYHPTGTVLTFSASLRSDNLIRNIIEYHWDFGDGTEAFGSVVTHTYSIANPGIIAHLRVTEDNGQKSYASMNMMLTPAPAPDREWLEWPDRWDDT